MLSLTRKMLPAFALAAMMTVAQAQAQTAPATDQDHSAHHPDGAAAATQAQPTPAQPTPNAKPGMPGQPGMMMGMDQMRAMMSGMMGPQDGQLGMMGNMGAMMRSMMPQQSGMGLPFEHVEGRIAFLKAELTITDAQTPPWNAFADTLRANAKTHQAMHEQMAKGMPATWSDRLAAQQAMLGKRLDGLKALEAVAKPLYAVLTDEQKKMADTLLSGPMGMM